MEDVIEAPAAEAEEIPVQDAADAAEPEAAPEPERQESEPAGEEASPEEGGKPGGEQEPETDIYAGEDGKKIPAKLAPVFKKYPELRSMFFENREARQHGGVKALVEAARTLEEAGGRQGIEGLKGDIAAYERLDELFTAGDARLAVELFDADPDAAAKIAPAFIEKFAAADPAGYSHIMGRAMLNTLQGFRAYDAIAALEKLAQDKPEMADSVAPLVKLWNAVYEAAQQAPEKKVDPEREKLNAEREAFERQREDAFVGDVLGDAKRHMEGVIEAELGRYFQQNGIDLKALRKNEPEFFEVLVKECDARLGKALKQDQAFNQNKERFHQAHDAAGLKQLYRNAIDRAMPGVAKAVHRLFDRHAPNAAAAPKPKPVPQAAAGNRTAQAGIVRVQRAPDGIDWGRPPKGYASVAEAVLDGRAFVKGKRDLHVWQ